MIAEMLADADITSFPHGTETKISSGNGGGAAISSMVDGFGDNMIPEIGGNEEKRKKTLEQAELEARKAESDIKKLFFFMFILSMLGGGTAVHFLSETKPLGVEVEKPLLVPFPLETGGSWPR